MIGTTILPKIIRAAILSTRVQCEGLMPVSLFVVAPFEQGKTRLVLENSSKDSLIVSDVTGIGLLESLQMSPMATTVVVNDLSVVSGHKNSVSHLTVAILNALAEEGCYKIAMPKMQHLDLRGRKVNVIACCVPDIISDRRSWWYRSGFMSRLLQVHFSHSISLQLQIHKAIQNGIQESKASQLEVPASIVRMSIEDKNASDLALLAKEVFKNADETGYRKHKQIRALAAGHALSRTLKATKVDKEDVEFIEECIPFFSKNGNQI